MDEIVKAAIAKWPNVPHCYGWLALDARGQWRMRDERCQALKLPGEIIRHPALIDFINRNYQCDDQGCWYFQNGPQRVYVELEATPFIAYTTPTGLRLHTGQVMQSIIGAYFDESGHLVFASENTLAQVDDRDVAECLNWIRIDGHECIDDDLLLWLEQTTLSVKAHIFVSNVEVIIQKENVESLMKKRGYTPHPSNPNAHKDI